MRTCSILLAAMAGVACVDDLDDELLLEEAALEAENISELACTPSPDTFTPYTSGTSPLGTVAALPWRGASSSYPGGIEDFRNYALPSTVECSSAKARQSHLEVTAGCLTAANVGGASRGQIASTSAGAFRALALGFATGNPAPAKWTAQSQQFRFFYDKASGAGVLPGWKAFARYRDEDNLYVASWRLDGVVQIQKKQCGVYTALATAKTFGAPSPRAWHTFRFDANGTKLTLSLDGRVVLTATDAAFSWGTMGIRTDAMTGAYVDDWIVRAP